MCLSIGEPSKVKAHVKNVTHMVTVLLEYIDVYEA